jgi:hypothetical protein
MAWRRSFEEGMVARLNADVSVSLATSGNLLPAESHEQIPPPYIVYKISYQAVEEMGQPRTWNARIELLAWGTSYDNALDLGEDAESALAGDNLTLSGVAVRHIRPQDFSIVEFAPTSGVIQFGSLVEFTAMIDT